MRGPVIHHSAVDRTGDIDYIAGSRPWHGSLELAAKPVFNVLFLPPRQEAGAALVTNPVAPTHVMTLHPASVIARWPCSPVAHGVPSGGLTVDR
jgi:hypothetical protein